MKRVALILGSLLLLVAMSGCAGYSYQSYRYSDDYYRYHDDYQAPLGFHGESGDNNANLYGY